MADGLAGLEKKIKKLSLSDFDMVNNLVSYAFLKHISARKEKKILLSEAESFYHKLCIGTSYDSDASARIIMIYAELGILKRKEDSVYLTEIGSKYSESVSPSG